MTIVKGDTLGTIQSIMNARRYVLYECECGEGNDWIEALDTLWWAAWEVFKEAAKAMPK